MGTIGDRITHRKVSPKWKLANSPILREVSRRRRRISHTQTFCSCKTTAEVRVFHLGYYFMELANYHNSTQGKSNAS
jgi:hypothetical protein